jgi:hypothetical protein
VWNVDKEQQKCGNFPTVHSSGGAAALPGLYSLPQRRAHTDRRRINHCDEARINDEKGNANNAVHMPDDHAHASLSLWSFRLGKYTVL